MLYSALFSHCFSLLNIFQLAGSTLFLAAAVAGTEKPNALLARALWYAREALLFIFPVFEPEEGGCSCGDPECPHPGKHPRTAHGYKDATRDEKIIRQWWTQWPHANIGIDCGRSGLLVLDNDVRNGGQASHAELVAYMKSKYGVALPESLTVRTGSNDGSTHEYFRHPWADSDYASSELEQGLELKGPHGCVIAPPSRHHTGSVYRVDGGGGAKRFREIADAPEELLALVRNGSRQQHTPREDHEQKWIQGVRNKRLFRLACSQRGQGLTVGEITTVLLATNQAHCVPPLSDREIIEIAKSSGRYKRGAPPREEPQVRASDDSYAESAPAAGPPPEEWPEPIPFRRSITPAIPADLFPGFLGDMVAATARATETPVELAALLGLGVVAASVARKVIVSPEPGYTEPVNIYTVVGMESGNRKTAALNAVRRPFVDWETSEEHRLKPEIRRITSERKTREARIESLRKKAAKALDFEPLLAEIVKQEALLPQVPISPRLWTQDVTPEHLGTLMVEQDERIALVSDEGGIFEVLAGRYSRGVPNLDLFLQAHAGASVRVDRGSRPPVKLNNPALTVALAPQPDVLESLSDKPGFRGRGLIARILYALPASPLGFRKLEPVPCPPAVERAYGEGITRLLKLRPPTDEAGLWQPWRLRFSPQAYVAWKAFQRLVEILMREGEKLYYLKDWSSKLPGAAARVAGVFHCVSEDPSGSAVISRSTMESALTLVTLLMDHALAVFNLMERDKLSEDAQKILDWIRKQGKPSFLGRDCFCAHQARFKTMDGIGPVFRILEQHYCIRERPRQAVRYRPSDVYDVNPKLSVVSA
jgi:hypothetical protein